MAAEVLVNAGLKVDIYDAMTSLGRKFLMAGKGGLNLTHAEGTEAFLSRYGSRRANLESMLTAFDRPALLEWVRGLGVDTFVGSSGRVFPTGMKAAPLLRAWLHRQRASGTRIHVRHRWMGWTDDGALRFVTPQGEHCARADIVILALGGGSWARLGSDAAWVPLLAQCGVQVAPLRPANCGFDIGWSEYFRSRFAGQPLKSVVASFTDSARVTHRRQGECIVTDTGLEGGLIYALCAPLRDEIAATGSIVVLLDLLPELQQKDAHSYHVHDNKIHDNNLPNFAEKNTLAGTSPQGTGILVLAPTALTLWVVWKLFTFFDERCSSATTASVANWIPRCSDIGLAPAVTFLTP